MKSTYFKVILILFASSWTSLQAHDHSEHIWPPLPDSGFIKGRAATKADVDQRNAVFAFIKDDEKSTPLNIPIPQYGLLTTPGSKKTTPVIIIQAEKVRGMDMVGYVNLKNNKRAVTLLKKVKLLGKELKKTK